MSVCPSGLRGNMIFSAPNKDRCLLLMDVVIEIGREIVNLNMFAKKKRA